MQKVAVRPAPSAPVEPVFGGPLARDAEAATKYFTAVEAVLQAQKAEQQHGDAAALKTGSRAVKEQFFRRHAVAIYDEVTDKGARTLRVSELVAAVSARYPALLPTREQIDAERALMEQSAKEGREIDQGLFIAQVLADERCGMHLIHAMLKPRREALERIAEFRRTGFADLGGAKVERKGKVGHVTLTNAKFLNAEDDRATAALETAVDLVLLDDGIEVGVLARRHRGASEICRPAHLQRRHQPHASLLRPDFARRILHRA